MVSPTKLIFAALALTAKAQGFLRGSAWAADNQWAPAISQLPLIQWYHHWADGPVPQMASRIEYVPMFWGSANWGAWNERVAEMKQHTPKHLMGFNEPDVNSQSNMDPTYAAELWMEQIQPWGYKGTLLISPAIVYNTQWMDTFLAALKSKGGHIDKMAIHWYGSWQDFAGFQKWVTTVHSRYGYNIWITELGITTASYPSQANVKGFMIEAVHWLESLGYVDRLAWFGCFANNNPPDNYATGKNGLFGPGGQLADLFYWYGYSNGWSKRDMKARHAQIAARALADADADVDGYTGEPVHCDKHCKLRKEFIAKHEAEHGPVTIPPALAPTTPANATAT